MLEPLLENPWPVFGAVLLAAFVGYVTWRNNLKNRRAGACDAFRAAVLGKIAGLYPAATNWPENIDDYLRRIFPDLQVAVARFRPFIPWYKRRAFDRAWLCYRSAYLREIDVQCYHHYIGFDDQPDPKSTFRDNVDRLLSYAKET